MQAQILATATQLFIEHGYHGLSMRQIAAAVGVTKPALYYHFKDKESLFLAILETYLAKIEKLLDEIFTTDASSHQQIRLLVERILHQPTDQRAVIRLASQEMAHLSADARIAFGESYHNRFIGRIQTMVEAGMARGELRQGNPQVATWTLLGMLYPYFYPVHSNHVVLSDEAIDQLVSIYLEGVSSPEK